MYKIYLIPLLFVVVSSFTFFNKEYVEVKNHEIVLKKIKSVADKTVSITSDYKEKKYLAAFKNPQLIEGKFYYKKDNKMRWEQNTPSEFIILINGEVLRIKNDGKEKKMGAGKQMALKINEFMMNLIQGEYQNNREFITTCYESSQKYLIKLLPKQKPLNKVYSDLELYFSKKDNRLESIVFHEKGGDKRVVTFFNQVYNGEINNKLFTNL